MRAFNNKTRFDPGRLRQTIGFYRQEVVDRPGGGSSVLTHFVVSKRAGELPLNDHGNIEMLGGASLLNDDRLFVIRASKTFIPEKDMNVAYDGNYYTIVAINPLDIPVNYYKILCIRKDDYAAWLETVVFGSSDGFALGGDGFILGD